MSGQKQPSSSIVRNPQRSDYWMRAVSFAVLHRILKALDDYSKDGLSAGELNELALASKLVNTRRNSIPSPTTLYHYRNTLLHLRLLNRDGRILRVNKDDPDVHNLLQQPAPVNMDSSLTDAARDRFASLVLKNTHCRSLFFDLFMPKGTTSHTLNDFTKKGSPVTWSRYRSDGTKAVSFRNEVTGRTSHCTSHSGISAVLYGLRYWARDELKIIDEYSPKGKRGIVMFPLARTIPQTKKPGNPVLQTVETILSRRIDGEWAVFSVSDLIARCCEERRQPIGVLFRAIDWLLREWPHHIVLIPTSRSLATLTAMSSQSQKLELKRYYSTKNGPYISHIRIHKDVAVNPRGAGNLHVQYPSEVQA